MLGGSSSPLPDASLVRLLLETFSTALRDRLTGSRDLRAHLIHRLYFANFAVTEEIASWADEAVPLLIGVKGHARESSRALLLTSTVRPALLPDLAGGGRGRAAAGLEPRVEGDHLVAPGAHCGLADVACKLAALARLKDSEVNRPVVFLVSLDDPTRGSGVLTLLTRYGLEVSSALIGHPTGGALASATPGALALDVVIRSVAPDWQVRSLDPLSAVSASGQPGWTGDAGALSSLLQALAGAVRRGAAVFNLESRGPMLTHPAEARALLGGGEAPRSAGVACKPAAPREVGFPFGPEVDCAARLDRELQAALPGCHPCLAEPQGEALRLVWALPLGGASEESVAEHARQVLAGVATGFPGLSLEAEPRLFRRAFPGSSERLRRTVAERAPGLAWAPSEVPSEGAFLPTEDALLYGPEDAGQAFAPVPGRIPLQRLCEMSEATWRLLVRLAG
jgi:hypothetical protein